MSNDEINRSKMFPIRFRPRDLEVIKEAAKLDLQRPTEWMRDTLVSKARERIAATKSE